MSKASGRMLASIKQRALASGGDASRRIEVAAGQSATRLEVLRQGVGEIVVSVGPGASLAWLLTRCPEAQASWRKVRVELAEGASLAYACAFELGAGQSHGEELSVEFLGPDARASVICRWTQRERSQLCQETLGWIRPRAPRASFEQSSKSIRLEGSAASLLEPNLKVEVEEAKAAHGAAHGQFDELAMHALASRGLARAQAEALLARSFLEQAWRDARPTEFERMKLGLPKEDQWTMS